MTNPKHTDTGRSVTTLTAPTLSVVGNFVPPDAVVFFDGDSVIRINRNGTLELGPKWADAGDAAAAFFNELVSRVVPSWNARLEALETENERLRGALRDIADERGECGTCGTLAVGGGGGITSCDCNYSYWVPRDAQTAARAALGEKQ